MEQIEEVWKDIPNFERRYQVSTLGNVKSLERYIGGGRSVPYLKKESMVKIYIDKRGYKYCLLCIPNRKHKTMRIHKLVAITFLSNDLPKGVHICHIDGNPLNNVVSNLYIGDVVSNTMDRYRQGRTKLTPQNVLEIIELVKTKSQTKIAEIYNVNQSYVSRILSKQRARFITQ